MKQAVLIILAAIMALGVSAYGVYRLHSEAQALIKASEDMISALESGRTEEALILSQWSYQRIKAQKTIWDIFVEHLQTDDALILLAQVQSAIKFGDIATAHRYSRVLREKLHCLDKDSLLSVGNLF